jgi:hypothetical protein
MLVTSKFKLTSVRAWTAFEFKLKIKKITAGAQAARQSPSDAAGISSLAPTANFKFTT